MPIILTPVAAVVLALNANAGSTTANSYSTLAEAALWLGGGRLYGADWDAASDADQTKALIWATSVLDWAFNWAGVVNTQEQALRWPRSGVNDVDDRYVTYTEIPAAIKQATAELALHLLVGDPTVVPELFGLGFSHAELGDLKVTLDLSQAPVIVPQRIVAALLGYGAIRGQILDSGFATAKLSRT